MGRSRADRHPIRRLHDLNQLCSFEGCRYLEIGSLGGASTCAALYGNDVRALCIENWSQFGGSRETFEENLGRLAGSSSVRLIDADCFAFDNSELGPFDVYFYDGDHSPESQYLAIARFASTLASRAVVIVDDWNWHCVREATRRALRDLEKGLGLEVLFEREILLRDEDLQHMPRHRGRHTWWNGIGVFLVNVPSSKGRGSV